LCGCLDVSEPALAPQWTVEVSTSGSWIANVVLHDNLGDRVDIVSGEGYKKWTYGIVPFKESPTIRAYAPTIEVYVDASPFPFGQLIHVTLYEKRSIMDTPAPVKTREDFNHVVISASY